MNASPHTPPTEPFFTIASLAEHWQVSRDAVRSMIARGELAAYRVGPRRIRIDPRDARKALRPANPAGRRLAEAARTAAVTTSALALLTMSLAASLAPPPTRPRAFVPTQPKAGAETPEEVCLAPWRQLAEVHAAARSMPNKREACDLLARRFPERSRGWFVRNLSRLMAMSPLDFAGEIGDHRHHGEALPKAARAGVSLGE